MEQTRGSDRKGCGEIIEFSVAVLNDNKIRIIDLTGRAINMSKNGLCLITRYPLRSGHVLKFKNSMGQYGHGIVLWIKELGDHYIAGAELVEGSPA
ncbi:MAG: hypothetical protein FIA94_12395 [Nitrospirae bacterium]|nr:hypothetical protein [Nitrospirota bacterium]